jgi:two-component system response regulator FixJ
MGQTRLRIAVVDDEDCVRKAVGRLLRSAGMEVESFASGRDFLRVVGTRQVDCLILDLHMPLMNGFEVHEDLVRRGIRLPVVIITGHDKPEYRACALAAGMAAYLPKPIDDQVLLGAITAAVPRVSGR